MTLAVATVRGMSGGRCGAGSARAGWDLQELMSDPSTSGRGFTSSAREKHKSTSHSSFRESLGNKRTPRGQIN